MLHPRGHNRSLAALQLGESGICVPGSSTRIHGICTYLVCHKATALEAPLLFTSTRLLIQVIHGTRYTVDDFPCCRLTGVHHGDCTRGPEVGLHVYYILKRADKACTFTCQLLTIYIHQAVDTSGPLASSSHHSPSSSKKTKHHAILPLHAHYTPVKPSRSCMLR